MRATGTELLWVIPLAPLGVALLLFPISRVLPRPFVVVATLLAWLSSSAAAAYAFQQQLARGGWDQMTTTGFRGAWLVAHDLSGATTLSADPLSVLLALGFAIAAFLALVGSIGAWGGGPRATPKPISAGQLLGLSLLLGLAHIAVLSTSLPALFGAVALASVVGWTLMSSADPKREQRDAAGQMFVLQRAGDAAWFLALVVVLASWDVNTGALLAERSAATEAWTRLAGGPFAGFPASTLFSVTGALVLAGVASRIPLLPLPMLYRQATGMPAPALAFVHGVGSFALGLVVLLRTAPLWDRSELVLAVALVLAALSAAIAALSAATSRDVVRIDLHLLHSLAALGVVAALVGQPTGATLFALTVIVLAPCLLASTGAVLEALQGRADVLEMGGLARSLKLSDRTRALATLSLTSLPPFATWLALERTLFESLDSRFSQPAAAVLVVVTAGTLSFAGFRALHLVYSGEAPRAQPPANLIEAPLWRSLAPLVVSFAALALCVLALPSAFVGSVLPGHTEPLQRFLEPAWLALSFEPLNDESGRGLARRGLPLAWRYGGMAALFAVAVVGYALSAALYRKGPTKLHARLTRTRVPERTAALAESTLGLERVFLSWLPAFSLRAAQVFTAVVLSVVLEGLVTRAVALVGALARVLIRLLHNGDVQRALFFVVLVAASLLFVWGRA